MFELSSVDLHYAVRELQLLVGAKVEKAFQSDANKRDVLLQLYCADGKKRNLRFLLPGVICTPKEKPNYPQLPPGFAMFLRKRLGGTRIVSVEQAGFDRILRIGFEAKRDAAITSMMLVAEMMPPGNLLLLDDENRIINLLEQQQYKDRQLRSHSPYTAPPSSYNITAASDEELARHLTASTRQSIVTTLAMHCSLGGVYAEEVCVRAGIAKHRNDLSQEEIAKIVGAIKEILTQPIAAASDGERAYPFMLKSKRSATSQNASSQNAERRIERCEESLFLDALCAFVSDDTTTPVSKVAQRREERASPKTKLKSMIDAQQANADRLAKAAIDEQHKAEMLYTEYQRVQHLLEVVQAARKEKKDIKSLLAGQEGFIAYNDATGELTIELPDAANAVEQEAAR
jgi:predicted ribosome quality control (RQC) complex YloA/Tae2 family protein